MPISPSIRNALCFALSLLLLYLAMFCGACVPAANAQSQTQTQSQTQSQSQASAPHPALPAPTPPA